MFWSYIEDGKEFFTFGSSLKEGSRPRYDAPIYNGEEINQQTRIVFHSRDRQGKTHSGVGDLIWMANYLREFNSIVSKYKAQITVYSDEWTIQGFWKHFLPSNIRLVSSDIPSEEIIGENTYALPGIYHFSDNAGGDKTWAENTSLLSRMYSWSGIEYNGLLSWSEFTPSEILSPSEEFYSRLKIDRSPFIFFQWHSTGASKNIPQSVNVELLNHLSKKHPNLKIYLIGTHPLEYNETIPNVVNLMGDTKTIDLFSLAKNCEFIVAPDSAGLHLSEAYMKPSVIVMSVLPPAYVAYKYKYPAFMFGAGSCPFKPCGHFMQLPKFCPSDDKNCNVLKSIDLNLFDRCLSVSYSNVDSYRRTKVKPFYNSQYPVITTK